MSQTPSVNLNLLRQRILEGEHPTREELKAAIALLRTERTISTEKSTTKRKATKGLSDAELMSDLDTLLASAPKAEVKL